MCHSFHLLSSVACAWSVSNILILQFYCFFWKLWLFSYSSNYSPPPCTSDDNLHDAKNTVVLRGTNFSSQAHLQLDRWVTLVNSTHSQVRSLGSFWTSDAYTHENVIMANNIFFCLNEPVPMWSGILLRIFLMLYDRSSHCSHPVISITLGGFGADRFYLGQTTYGVIKLFTFGGIGLWGLVDIILTATGYLSPADGSGLLAN